jgi:hypothetical protein
MHEFTSYRPGTEDCTRLFSSAWESRGYFVKPRRQKRPGSRESSGTSVAGAHRRGRACARWPGAAALNQLCTGSLSAIRCDASCHPFADPRNGRVHGVAGGNREEARAQESFRGLHASCGGQDARTPGDDGRGFRFKPSSRSGAAALVVWVASRLSSPRVEA